jgi:hypothetical protein
VHAGALVVPEYIPAGQATQRSSTLLDVSDSYVPGVHCVLTEQNGWPVCSWYLPVGHVMHSGALDELEYFPATQGMQMRFKLLEGCVLTLEPATQMVIELQ